MKFVQIKNSFVNLNNVSLIIADAEKVSVHFYRDGWKTYDYANRSEKAIKRAIRDVLEDTTDEDVLNLDNLIRYHSENS